MNEGGPGTRLARSRAVPKRLARPSRAHTQTARISLPLESQVERLSGKSNDNPPSLCLSLPAAVSFQTAVSRCLQSVTLSTTSWPTLPLPCGRASSSATLCLRGDRWFCKDSFVCVGFWGMGFLRRLDLQRTKEREKKKISGGWDRNEN